MEEAIVERTLCVRERWGEERDGKWEREGGRERRKEIETEIEILLLVDTVLLNLGNK